jgi:hypothetical protein
MTVMLATVRSRFIGVLLATLLAMIANGGCSAAKAVDGGTDAASFTADCDPLPDGADSGCLAPESSDAASQLRYPFGCAASVSVEGAPRTCVCRAGLVDASAWACGV